MLMWRLSPRRITILQKLSYRTVFVVCRFCLNPPKTQNPRSLKSFGVCTRQMTKCLGPASPTRARLPYGRHVGPPAPAGFEFLHNTTRAVLGQSAKTQNPRSLKSFGVCTRQMTKCLGPASPTHARLPYGRHVGPPAPAAFLVFHNTTPALL